MSRSRESFYRTDYNSINVATTYLTLDKNAIYPQHRSAPEILIAKHLLENFGKMGELTMTQVSEAEIDPEITWEYTWKIHAAYGVGTDRKFFRNPNNPDSPEVYPINKEYLAIFTKGFVDGAIKFIRDHIACEKPNINIATPIIYLERLLEVDIVLRKSILQYANDITDGFEFYGERHREHLRQEAEKKYGPGGVKYHKENFE